MECSEMQQNAQIDLPRFLSDEHVFVHTLLRGPIVVILRFETAERPSAHADVKDTDILSTVLSINIAYIGWY